MEDPGNPDARKILQSNFGALRFQPVYEEGMIVDERLRDVDLVLVTPNRQVPTTVTMSERRRHALLQAAEAYDFYIIEDDYECDVDYRHAPPLPLHSLDTTGRLIYLGSMSKGLSPGLSGCAQRIHCRCARLQGNDAAPSTDDPATYGSHLYPAWVL